MLNSFYEDLRYSFKSKETSKILNKASQILSKLAERENLVYHPLGFVYARLHEFENKETIRIHIWDEQRLYQKPLMDIHDHYYTVNSFVLKGRIRNDIFSIKNKAPNYTIYIGEYSPNGERVLKRTDEHLYAELSYSETIAEGNLYQITTDQLHSSFVEDNLLTCTLVYTESPGEPNPLVLGPYEGEDEYHYPIRVVEPVVVEAIIEKLFSK